MAMLAERRRKTRFVLTPVAKPLWVSQSSSTQFGKKMMEKMGWSAGKGLGATEQGIQEPLRAVYKQDSKGMGYNGQGNPFENLDQFNALLSSLAGSSKEINNTDEAYTFESLEEKSKKSRSRVHYKKFTRGKDLSKCSNTDISCIVGTGKKAEEEEIEEEEVDRTGEHEHSHGVTTINSGSIADYFKLKLEQRKSGTASQVQIEDNDTTQGDIGNVDVIRSEEKTKKLKRKEYEEENKNENGETQEKECIDFINSFDKNQQEDLLDEVIQNCDQWVGEKKIKKRKRKERDDKVNETIDNDEEVIGNHITEEYIKKKKKQRRHNNMDVKNEVIDNKEAIEMSENTPSKKQQEVEVYGMVKDKEEILKCEKNKKKRKLEEIINVDTANEEDLANCRTPCADTTKKKKKKKMKESEKNYLLDNCEDYSTNEEYKKRKRRNEKITDETVHYQNGESGILECSKKKKKSKEKHKVPVLKSDDFYSKEDARKHKICQNVSLESFTECNTSEKEKGKKKKNGHDENLTALQVEFHENNEDMLTKNEVQEVVEDINYKQIKKKSKKKDKQHNESEIIEMDDKNLIEDLPTDEALLDVSVKKLSVSDSVLKEIEEIGKKFVGSNLASLPGYGNSRRSTQK